MFDQPLAVIASRWQHQLFSTMFDQLSAVIASRWRQEFMCGLVCEDSASFGSENKNMGMVRQPHSDW